MNRVVLLALSLIFGIADQVKSEESNNNPYLAYTGDPVPLWFPPETLEYTGVGIYDTSFCLFDLTDPDEPFSGYEVRLLESSDTENFLTTVDDIRLPFMIYLNGELVGLDYLSQFLWKKLANLSDGCSISPTS